MNKYKAKIQYNKAIMESPWCTVEGDREVFANNEDEARQIIINQAEFHDLESFEITEIYLTDKGQ